MTTESNRPPRNGGVDLAKLGPPLLTIAVAAGGAITTLSYTSAEVDELRQELRLHQRDEHPATNVRLTRVEDRVSRNETDTSAVAGKLTSIEATLVSLDKKADRLCTALGERCRGVE